MADLQLKYSVLPEKFAVCRLPPSATIPEWALASQIFSVMRTADELSVVCGEELVPAGTPAERGWACIQLRGPFPFEMTGVLAAVLNPLAVAGLGIFAMSTFDTDYILVKADRLRAAQDALSSAGHIEVR